MAVDYDYAVVGARFALMTTLIRVMLQSRGRWTEGAPPVRILIVNLGSRAPLDIHAPYPLKKGIEPSGIHPFIEPKPPEGFPDYGKYFVQAKAAESPDGKASPFWRFTVIRPTHQELAEYLDFAMEMAIEIAGDAVRLTAYKDELVRVDQEDDDGSVVFVSPTSTIRVRTVVEASLPPSLETAEE